MHPHRLGRGMTLPFGHARSCASDLILAQDALTGAAKSLTEVPGTEPVAHLEILRKLSAEVAGAASKLHREVGDRLLSAGIA